LDVGTLAEATGAALADAPTAGALGSAMTVEGAVAAAAGTAGGDPGGQAIAPRIAAAPIAPNITVIALGEALAMVAA
jgi:hypothetical protein